jgi:hypothetical protein
VRVDASASGSLGDDAEAYKKIMTKDELTAAAKTVFSALRKAVAAKVPSDRGAAARRGPG